MDGLVYLLNKAGEAMLQAERQIAVLQAERDELARELEEIRTRASEARSQS